MVGGGIYQRVFYIYIYHIYLVGGVTPSEK